MGCTRVASNAPFLNKWLYRNNHLVCNTLWNISQCFPKEGRQIRALTCQWAEDNIWFWPLDGADLLAVWLSDVCGSARKSVAGRAVCAHNLCVLYCILSSEPWVQKTCRHTCVRVILSMWVYFFFFFPQDNKNINLPWNHSWRKCRAVPIGTQ